MFNSTQNRWSSNIWKRYRMPLLIGCLLTFPFLLLGRFALEVRQTESRLLDGATLIALSICLTGLMITARQFILRIAIPTKNKSSSLLLLSLTHLYGCVILGMLADGLFAGLFPVLLACTFESLLRIEFFATPDSLSVDGLSPMNTVETNEPRLFGGSEISAGDETTELEGSQLEPACSQQFSRYFTQGCETIAGQARAEFYCGERAKAIHIAFCPPLATAPKAEVFQITGPNSTIKSTLVEKFGMRLEIKLANDVSIAHKQDVVIEFVVQSQKACA